MMTDTHYNVEAFYNDMSDELFETIVAVGIWPDEEHDDDIIYYVDTYKQILGDHEFFTVTKILY